MHPSVYEPPHQHPAPGASRREWGSTRAIAALGLGFRVPQDATDCWTRCDLARLEPSRTELNLPKPWCWTSESQKEKRRWGEPRWKAAPVTGICLDVARKPLHPGRAQRRPVSDFPPLWTCRASQVARSEAEGHGKWGRLFFAYFLLAKQKKAGRPPGRDPASALSNPTKHQKR